MATINKSDLKAAMGDFFEKRLKACVSIRGGRYIYYVLNGNDDDSHFDYVESDANMLAHILVPAFLIASCAKPENGCSVIIPRWAENVASNQEFQVV